MGWDPTQKKVIRLNGRNVGPIIWDLDAQASQVIDSAGHDLHDQDLADSISASLHTGGYNSMTADLDLGGNKLTGMAPATDPADALNLNQYYNAMSFNESSRVLTISAPDGGSITTLIPGGEGGGSVTSITLGNGITGSANPLTSVGSVELAPVSPDPVGDYVDGIARITVDQYGRVTLVEDGYGVGVDLGLTRDTVEAVITNTGGADATIPGATDSLAGLMVATDKVKLDGLVQDVDLASTTNTTSVTITNTGGANATVLAANSSRAGVITSSQYDILTAMASSAPVEAGTVTGRVAIWDDGNGYWEETSSIAAVPGSGVSLMGGNTHSDYRIGMGDNVRMENDLTVLGTTYLADVDCDGILIADSFPNLEFDDTGAGGTNFSFGANGGANLLIKGAGSADTVSDGFIFTKSSPTSVNIQYLEAYGAAKFKGILEGSVEAVLTTAEMDALVDFLETNGIVSPARAPVVKAAIAAGQAPIPAP